MNCTGFDFDLKKRFRFLAKRLINRHTLFIPFPTPVHGYSGVTIPLKNKIFMYNPTLQLICILLERYNNQ